MLTEIQIWWWFPMVEDGEVWDTVDKVLNEFVKISILHITSENELKQNIKTKRNFTNSLLERNNFYVNLSEKNKSVRTPVAQNKLTSPLKCHETNQYFQNFPWPSLTPCIIHTAAWHISWIRVSLSLSGNTHKETR